MCQMTSEDIKHQLNNNPGSVIFQEKNFSQGNTDCIKEINTAVGGINNKNFQSLG